MSAPPVRCLPREDLPLRGPTNRHMAELTWLASQRGRERLWALLSSTTALMLLWTSEVLMKKLLPAVPEWLRRPFGYLKYQRNRQLDIEKGEEI